MLTKNENEKKKWGHMTHANEKWKKNGKTPVFEISKFFEQLDRDPVFSEEMSLEIPSHMVPF